MKLIRENDRNMRLTTEQRLIALERENVVLQGKVTMLHKLLKEQRRLINDYITRKITSANQTEAQTGTSRPEDALYTFKCKQKFDRLEKDIDRINKSMSNSRLDLKAG
jgi:hypothetical protein